MLIRKTYCTANALRRMLLFCCTLVLIPYCTFGKKTVGILIAGRSDLAQFIPGNLNQCKGVGSSPHLNIIVQVETNKGAQRYFVEKGKLVSINHLDPSLKPRNNTGDPKTLIDFVTFCTNYFPGEMILVLWDHGTGPKAPYASRALQIDDLCTIVTAHTYRSIITPMLPYFFEELPEPTWKGVLFDDEYRSYLTEAKLNTALKTICETCLPEKFSLIIFDTCLEANISTMHILKNYTQYMCASEEVVPGPGMNYTKMLTPLAHAPMPIESFARHVVRAYEETYKSTFSSYTLAALDLRHTEELEKNIDTLAKQLIQALASQQGASIKETIIQCGSKQMCTIFDQPDYIDLRHFYTNLLHNLSRCRLKRSAPISLSDIKKTLQDGLALIDKTVIERCAGNKRANARGISIYFPKKMHPSYKQSLFGQHNSWNFLILTLLAE